MKTNVVTMKVFETKRPYSEEVIGYHIKAVHKNKNGIKKVFGREVRVTLFTKQYMLHQSSTHTSIKPEHFRDVMKVLELQGFSCFEVES